MAEGFSGASRVYGKVEESASLRRQRPAKVGKQRHRRGLASPIAKILLVLLLLSAAVWAGWSAVDYGLSNPRFHLASVKIHGAEFAAQSQLEEKFLADKGKSILRVPLRRRGREIEQIPWVRSAAVGRIFPNRLWVEVRERVPIAFLWGPDGVALVDEEGVILDAPQKASFKFHVIRGVSSEDSLETRRSKMQLFQTLMEELNSGDPPYSETISEVDLQDPGDVRVVVADSAGAILLHLGREDFLARYRIYLGHIQEWKQKFPSIQSIDLRYGGQVIINSSPATEPIPPADINASGESFPSQASHPQAAL